MKLKLRINKRSCRIDVPGSEPSLTDLINHIREESLASMGLSPETEFSLSLNGSDILNDTGQNLSSCGVVSGDLIYVILPNTTSSDGPAVSAALRPGADAQMSVVAENQNPEGASNSEEPSPSPDPQPCCSTSALECTEAKPSSVSASIHSLGPMMCSEATNGQSPLPLELMYERAKVNNPNEALVVAINMLMLENGFMSPSSASNEMPDGWRSVNNFYKLSYQHQLCNNCPTVLVAVPMGPLLFINTSITVMSTDVSRKLSLEPTDYVTDQWSGGSAAEAFKDLRKLSQMFKDTLVYPVISAAREALSLPAIFGLTALPPEVILRILRMLDVRSLVRLSAVCRLLHTWASDSMLWRYMCYRDIKNFETDDSGNPNWKEVYKRNFRKRLRGHSSFFQPFPFNEELEPRHPMFDPPPFQPWPFQDPFNPFPNPLRPLIDPINPFPIPNPLRPLIDPINPFPVPNPLRPLMDPVNPFPNLPRPRMDLIHPLPNRGRPPFSGNHRGRGHSWLGHGFR